jgi:quercetin 2,3-dioxygenase
MIVIRKAEARGIANHGWLDSRHTFSFADYYDPAHMGFRKLRVINEDKVAGGQGFGRHSHRDMEILSYVLDGALAHKDSMGTGSTIQPGDVQVMSAGTGVSHSEMNPNANAGVHFLQIWLMPEKAGLKPRYEQKTFSDDEKKNKLRLVASRDGRSGSVTWNTDASLYASILEPGVKLTHPIAWGRHAWLQVVRGALELNGQKLRAGDGAAISEEPSLDIVATERSEFLLFDLV